MSFISDNQARELLAASNGSPIVTLPFIPRIVTSSARRSEMLNSAIFVSLFNYFSIKTRIQKNIYKFR